MLEHCVYCASQTVCLECTAGFYLDTGTNRCVHCGVENCQICSQNNPSLCLTCNSDYYLDSVNICQACNVAINGCLQCDSALDCIDCD